MMNAPSSQLNLGESVVPIPPFPMKNDCFLPKRSDHNLDDGMQRNNISTQSTLKVDLVVGLFAVELIIDYN